MTLRDRIRNRDPLQARFDRKWAKYRQAYWDSMRRHSSAEDQNTAYFKCHVAKLAMLEAYNDLTR